VPLLCISGRHGHGSIEGALDLTLEVTRKGKESTASVQSVKARDLPVSPFSALWTYEHDENGDLSKARFFGLGAPEDLKLSKQEQAELCIIKEMEDGMNQTALVRLTKQEAGIGRHTALAAIQSLISQKKVYVEAGEARSNEYHRTRA
jgi:hypothetical protein